MRENDENQQASSNDTLEYKLSLLQGLKLRRSKIDLMD